MTQNVSIIWGGGNGLGLKICVCGGGEVGGLVRGGRYG